MAIARTQADTYKWDSPSNEPVEWILAWTYKDYGVEIRPKVLHKIRPKGKFTDATVSVYGVTPDSVIAVNDLATGANSLFTYNLDDSTIIEQYAIQKVKCKNMLMTTMRIAGTSTFDGTGKIDQFHELALDVTVTGQER